MLMLAAKGSVVMGGGADADDAGCLGLTGKGAGELMLMMLAAEGWVVDGWGADADDAGCPELTRKGWGS